MGARCEFASVLRGAVLCGALALVFAAGCESTHGSRNPSDAYELISFPDSTGRAVTPGLVRDGRANVVIFMGLECPIANGYAPEIEAITREYAPKGVRTFLVFVDRNVNA